MFAAEKKEFILQMHVTQPCQTKQHTLPEEGNLMRLKAKHNKTKASPTVMRGALTTGKVHEIFKKRSRSCHTHATKN